MRTTPFRTMLETTLALAGIPYAATTQDQRDTAANHINLKLQDWWDAKPWPELLQFEERAFASPWDATRSYGVGDVVWSETEEAYYEAAQAGSGHAVTDAAWWTVTDKPARQVIDWEQYGQNKIGRVWGVSNTDPRLSTSRVEWEIILTDEGVVVPDATGNTVWIVFTKPASRFTAIEYSPTADYDRYDLVFYPGSENGENFPDRGEVSMLELDTNGDDFWDWVPFPAFLSSGISYLAAADMCRFMGGKDSIADRYELLGEQKLLDEWDKVRPLVVAWISEVA